MQTRVVRHAGFIDLDGNAAIVKCNLQVDVGNHAIPVWPMMLHMGGKVWKFHKEGNGPNSRTIYKEFDISAPDVELTLEEEFENLKIAYDGLFKINGQLGEAIDQYKAAINSMSEDYRTLVEAYNKLREENLSLKT